MNEQIEELIKFKRVFLIKIWIVGHWLRREDQISFAVFQFKDIFGVENLLERLWQ